MAIRNDNLGGTDWTSGENNLKADDLNDTFDAAVDVLQQSPCFYLTSTLYDVYDDFNSDTPTDPPDVSKWTVTPDLDTANSGTCTVTNTQNAGGTTNELTVTITKTGAGTPRRSYEWAKAIALTADRHTWMRVAYRISDTSSSGSSYPVVSFDGGSTIHPLVSVGDETKMSLSYNNILVVAKGSDEYDCYIGGKLIQNVTDSSFEIWLSPTTNYGVSGVYSYLYIDDVRQSKTSVN